MADFLASYAWVIWLALILVFLVIETLTLDLIFLMLAIGSVGGLVAHFAGATGVLQDQRERVAGLCPAEGLSSCPPPWP